MAQTYTNQHGRLGRGYTLIEVLITVAIMGFAAAVVVPNMLRGGTLGIQAAARTVMADMMFAQNEAMAQQSDRRVTFNITANGYQVEKFDTSTNAWVLERNPVLGGNSNHNYQINFGNDKRFRGIKIESVSFGGNQQVVFNDLGNPSSGGTIRLRFEDHVFEIKVAPFTGRITVERVKA